jgi:hypothetical protein
MPRAVDGPASLGVTVTCSVETPFGSEVTGGSTRSSGKEVIVILRLSGGVSLA